MALAKHQISLRVRYAETDQMGVVYHANYLVWMEMGRVELVRSLGLSYRDIEEQERLFLSVVEAECRYIFAARYDQEIIVETLLHRANPRLVEFAYRVLDAKTSRLLATGRTKHVWLGKDLRPARLPARYQLKLCPDEAKESVSAITEPENFSNISLNSASDCR